MTLILTMITHRNTNKMKLLKEVQYFNGNCFLMKNLPKQQKEKVNLLYSKVKALANLKSNKLNKMTDFLSQLKHRLSIQILSKDGAEYLFWKCSVHDLEALI